MTEARAKEATTGAEIAGPQGKRRAPAKKLSTQAEYDALKPGRKRAEYRDAKVDGLRLKIEPSGARSWILRFKFNGLQRNLNLGKFGAVSLADVRNAARVALGEAAKDLDPCAKKKEAKAAAKRQARAEELVRADLFENVVDEFLEKYARRKTRGHRETERLLKMNVVPFWTARRLSEIEKKDVNRVLDRMVARDAGVSANRTLAALRKLGNWAVSRGIIDRNPCEGVEAPTKETPRDRVLDERELALVWNAAEDLGFPYREILRLLILTGARKSEVACALWSEFDLQKRVWTIPASRSKNRREHVVPLSPAVVEIVAALPRFEKSGLLFGANGRPPAAFSDAKRNLDSAVAKLNDGQAIPHFMIHDIRRSAASGMAALKTPPHVIEAVLNHKSGVIRGVAAVYNRYDHADEKRSALEAWARHVDAIVSGRPGSNIVEFSSARG